MGLLGDFLAQIDNRKRVAANSVRGLLADPLGHMGLLASRYMEQNLPTMADATDAASVMPQVSGPAVQKFADFGLNTGLNLGAIKAYHGSPYTFDKFDLGKIGTGEGAQAYGHGLYFAEHPEVAKGYAAANTGKAAARSGWIDTLPKSVQVELYKALQASNGAIRAEALKNARKKLGNRAKELDEKISEFGGAEYEVSLRWPDAAREASDPLGPQHFLDWDAPLSKQPKAVQEATLRAYGDVRPVRLANGRYAVTIVSGDQSGRIMYAIDEPTADAAMQSFRNEYPKYATGSDIYLDLQRFADKTPAPATSALLNRGIPGIRYLDAGSRGAGTGTSNYVVFDPELIEIMKRNGAKVR